MSFLATQKEKGYVRVTENVSIKAQKVTQISEVGITVLVIHAA